VDVTYFELASAVGLAIALAACAGLRAMVPLLLTGLLARVGWLDVGERFQFLAGTHALVLFGVATVLEIAGDKIPTVDHALDTVHTFLRPLAGTVLAAAVLSNVSEPATAIVLGIVLGAPTALVPHAARSTARVASSVLTFGLANPVLSVLEDVAAVALFILAVVVPLFAALLVLIVAFFLTRWVLALRARSMSPAPAR
jgi:hypothetical protein